MTTPTNTLRTLLVLVMVATLPPSRRPGLSPAAQPRPRSRTFHGTTTTHQPPNYSEATDLQLKGTAVVDRDFGGVFAGHGR